MVGKSDNRDVLYRAVAAQEVFDLNGIDVLAAGDDYVLFTVDKIDKAVLVLLCHVAREKPAVLQNRGGCLFVVIVAGHDSRTLDGKLADLAALDRVTVVVGNFNLPAVARFSDCADLVNVLNAEVNAAGTYRLAKTVVSIVLVVWEYRFPAFYKTGRNRLRAYMHKPPAGKVIFRKVDIAPVDCVQYILRPRHKQPYNSTFFVRYGFDYPLGFYSLQKHRAPARNQAAEPVHFCAGVIERRNTKKGVLARLTVVRLFGTTGVHKAFVVVKDCLGESRCTRREVYRRVVLLCKLYIGHS